MGWEFVVQSSNLRAVRYTALDEILDIQFRSGAVYRYLGVPPSVFTSLRNATSKGRYFYHNIRNRYRTIRL